MITKIKSKILLVSLKIRNTISRIFTAKKSTINIASNSNYKGKIKEDLNLEYYLLNNNVNCKIYSWNNYKKNDPIVIRSVWGYQNNTEAFNNFISDSKTITVNPSNILLKNMNKEDQLSLFVKYKLPHIQTNIIHNIKELETLNIEDKTVLKPTISASGENTYLINNNDELKNIVKKYQGKNINNIMVQPYIEEIKNGELSIIVIENEIMYGVRRFPGIFTSAKRLEYIAKDQLDKEIIEIINQIKNIKEYEGNSYYRLDIIKTNKEYQIIEIELLDPSLFIETIPNITYKRNVYDKLAKSIIKSIEKQARK